MRPRGRPPTPSARSSESDPVEIDGIAYLGLVAHLHDRAFAVLPLDLAQSGVECLLTLQGFNLLTTRFEDFVLRAARTQTGNHHGRVGRSDLSQIGKRRAQPWTGCGSAQP
jgi:hypothetical protein